MRTRRPTAPQPSLPFERELVVDLFAGGGGASLGLAQAYRHPDVAVNHDPIAIAVHRINHPETEHYQCDVFEVDPVVATRGRPVGVLWASPDCRHHSKAAGRRPRSKRVRGLAWVVVRWAAACKPRLIHLENVEEFADWGPLLEDGQPCQVRKGLTFRRWVRQLKNLGYVVEHREIVAADQGAPTTRKRLYVVARRDGQPIVWPAATHAKDGRGGLEKWRAAGDCIDWSLPACSIFADKTEARAWATLHKTKGVPQRPLAEATKRRIARGLWRYSLASPNPYIVPMRGTSAAHVSVHDLDDPLSTVTASGKHHALLSPVLTECANASSQRTFDAKEPMRTQCAQVKGGHFAVATGTLIPRYGERPGQEPRAIDVNAPVPTIVPTGNHGSLASGVLVQAAFGEGSGPTKRWGIGAADPHNPLATATASGGFAVATAHVAKFKFDSAGHAASDPMPTITAGGAMKRDAGAAHALGVVAGHLVHLTHQDNRDGYATSDPARTITAAHRGEQAIVSAYFEQAAGGPNSNSSRPRHPDEPLSTVTVKGCQQQLISAYLVKSYSNGGQWSAAGAPLSAVTTKDRMGLVEVVHVHADIIAPELLARARACAAFLHEYLPEQFPEPCDIVLVGDHVLVDITLRMLTPRELARAQGFPDSYVIEFGLFQDPDKPAGHFIRLPVTKTSQVRLIGNSVCPDVARAIARANLGAVLDLYRQHDTAALHVVQAVQRVEPGNDVGFRERRHVGAHCAP